ncbi:glycosyltransferase [Acinetobacter lwoffii]|uniref:glycosyltransferase n=1 Tax=Acinetobacter lwoffii TaxID=28090 RepID=UPI001D0F16E0|nr:glycosyltransferase [Acinetobacter lwoffii]
MAGTERAIVQLSQIYDNVVILVPGRKDIAFDGFNHLNIKSLEVGDFPEVGKLSKIFHRIKYFFLLKNNFIFSKDDILISFSFDLNILNIFLSMMFGINSIICEHIAYSYHKGLRNRIRKIFYSMKHVKLVCLTETDKLKFIQDDINTFVIPNFINPVKSIYNSESKSILAVGRLEYQKNFQFLIKAFELSDLHKKGWVLDIVGEGSEYEDIINLINLLNIKEFVKIHKFTKDIGFYYANASLLCMTSRFEALPMVLLEGMNYSLPVLVSNFPTGAKEILGESNSQIVFEYDENFYAKKLKELCLDKDLRKNYSLQNLQIIKNYYPENINKYWLDLI